MWNRYYEINELLWQILEVDPDDKLLLDEKGRSCYGICQNGSLKIYVDNSLPLDFKRQVIIHELGHAFIDSYMLSKKEKYSEEEVVEFVAIYAKRILDITNNYMEANYGGSSKDHIQRWRSSSEN